MRGLLACAGLLMVVSVAIAARSLLQTFANQPAAGASHSANLAWQADASLLLQLREPKGVDHFSLRLPEEFTALMVLPDPAVDASLRRPFHGLDVARPSR